jgi:hypothetical protein
MVTRWLCRRVLVPFVGTKAKEAPSHGFTRLSCGLGAGLEAVTSTSSSPTSRFAMGATHARILGGGQSPRFFSQGSDDNDRAGSNKSYEVRRGV